MQHIWVHVRRDFLKPAAGGEAFEAWRQQWIKRFAELFHLNKERRQSHAPDRVLTAQSAAFNTAHCRLQQAVDRVFTIAAAELAAATFATQSSHGADGLCRPSAGAHGQQPGICRHFFNADTAAQAIDFPDRVGELVGIKKLTESRETPAICHLGDRHLR